MKKTGIGIIGTGSIALRHIQAIDDLADAEVIALYNPNPKSAAEAREAFGLPVFTEIGQFLNQEDMDVVCICTPSGAHLEPALEAAAAGKHILLEKPIEISLDRADKLIACCERNQVKLGVIFQNRFSEDYQKLKRKVSEGGFGRLLMGNAYINWFREESYYTTSTWKGTFKGDGGGAFINQGVHTIDLLLDVMGEAESVFGQVRTSLYPIEGEDLGAAILNFRNGALGNITASTALYPGYPERLEVYGTEGSAVLEAGKLIAWNFRGKERGPEMSANLHHSGSSDPLAIDHQLHREQWRLFLRAIKEDSPCSVEGHVARRSLELIRAIYASSASNQTIGLPYLESTD